MNLAVIGCVLIFSCLCVISEAKHIRSKRSDTLGTFFNNGDFNTAPRIVNGRKSTIEQHPYQVYVLLQKNGQTYTCGGSIISPEWIVTAAHCLMDMDVLYVRAGSTYRTTGGSVYTPVRQLYHEEYNVETREKDVGLIKITPLEFNKFIQPVDLPNEDEDVPQGDYVVSGWGKLEDGGLPNRLRDVTVSLVDNDVCNRDYGGMVTNQMICAGTGGKDSCNGDSGGPLVSNNVLFGIVSWGAGCGEQAGVYVKVSKVRGWIRANTGI